MLTTPLSTILPPPPVPTVYSTGTGTVRSSGSLLRTQSVPERTSPSTEPLASIVTVAGVLEPPGVVPPVGLTDSHG